MRYLKFTFILSMFVLLFSNQSNSMDNRCYEFIDGLKNLDYDKTTKNVETSIFTDLGFEFLYDSTPDASFLDTNFNAKIRRNENNYPIIGILTFTEVLDKLKNNDVLISINDIDLSKLKDEEIEDLIYPSDPGNNYDLVLVREGQKVKTQIQSYEYTKEYRLFEFALNSINEINLKNSTVKFSGFLSSEREYSEYLKWPITKHARNTITYFDEEDGENKSTNCSSIPYDYAKENRLPISGETFAFKDLISEDSDKVYEDVTVNTYLDESTDAKEDVLLSITYNAEGEWEIKNKFNLVSFPFDKQKIIISMVDLDDFESTVLGAFDTNYLLLNHTKENLEIPGWNVTDIKFNTGNNFDLNGLVFSEASIIVDIERQSFYYIFKIILPIVLILIICWSSVWLNPREVESKLTITIVCLLSLIAYNFVIDNELPKLEYLTIMDWIILASYLFAAAPNILAIISFQLSEKIKYKKLSQKVDFFSKRFGITSYIFLILIIIIINVSSVPGNTINALSWAMMR